MRVKQAVKAKVSQPQLCAVLTSIRAVRRGDRTGLDGSTTTHAGDTMAFGDWDTDFRKVPTFSHSQGLTHLSQGKLVIRDALGFSKIFTYLIKITYILSTIFTDWWVWRRAKSLTLSNTSPKFHRYAWNQALLMNLSPGGAVSLITLWIMHVPNKMEDTWSQSTLSTILSTSSISWLTKGHWIIKETGTL